MERKIKVNLVIKRVDDQQDKELTGITHNSEAFVSLMNIREMLNAVGLKEEEVTEEKLVRLLKAYKLSQEIIASAFIDIERDDLFDKKMKSVDQVDEIIEAIKTLL